jgi:hypothetical protein
MNALELIVSSWVLNDTMNGLAIELPTADGGSTDCATVAMGA